MLLVIGGVVMMLALIAKSILSSVTQSEAVGYLVVLFAAIFIVGFAASWGPGRVDVLCRGLPAP